MENILDLEFGLWLSAWLIVAAGIILTRWRGKTGVGLVTVYLILWAQTFWLPAILYVLPWYTPLYARDLTRLGFQQNLYGLIAFAGGVLLIRPRNSSNSQKTPPEEPVCETPDSRLPKLYLGIGLLGYFVIAPLSAGIPTLVALTTGFSSLPLVGMTLGCWQAWQTNNRRALAGWLAVAFLWPFITMANQGFLGFGVLWVIVVIAFVVQFVGFQKRLILPILLVGYLTLSFYVAYMQNRDDIRAAVWNPETSLTQRVDSVFDSFDDFEWFDIRNQNHLIPIDKRQMHNFLVGIAMERISRGDVDYALGETIWQSVLMLVPRVLWPDKSIRTGGSSLVTQYTGIAFYGGTSIGTSQVLEFYINFGVFGVILGFLILGALFAVMDETATRNLRRGDWQRFALWYLPAIGLLQPANTLVSLTAASVSDLIAIVLVNSFFIPVFLGKSTHASLSDPLLAHRAPYGRNKAIFRSAPPNRRTQPPRSL